MACSSDGTVAFVHLKANDIGQLIEPSEFISMVKQHYGDLLLENRKPSHIVESIHQLDLELQNQLALQRNTVLLLLLQPETDIPNPLLNKAQTGTIISSPNHSNSNHALPSSSHHFQHQQQQREIRLADGRRRITPQFIGSRTEEICSSPQSSSLSLGVSVPPSFPIGISCIPSTMTNNSSISVCSSVPLSTLSNTTAASVSLSIQTESSSSSTNKQQQQTSTTTIDPPLNTVTSKATNLSASLTSSDSTTKIRDSQSVNVNSNGLSVPLHISERSIPPPDDEENIPSIHHKKKSKGNIGLSHRISKRARHSEKRNRESRVSMGEQQQQQQEQEVDDDDPRHPHSLQDLQPILVNSNTTATTISNGRFAAIHNASFEPTSSKNLSTVPIGSVSKGSSFRLNPPPSLPKLSVQLPSAYSFQTAQSLEVSIDEINTTEVYSHVACYSGKLLWEDRIKNRASLVTGNSNFSAVGCSDGSLYIYSPMGRYLFPCIVLGEPLSILECNKTSHLMAITCSGTVSVWDLIVQHTIVKSVSVHSLISQPNLTIRRAKLMENGIPLITFSNGSSFAFHTDLQLWMRISDDRFTNSEFYSWLRPELRAARGSLSELQSLVMPSARMTSIQTGLSSTGPQKSLETISHLEHQIASALLLQSAKEYRHWLHIYVRRLTDLAHEAKLFELCSSLLGPSHAVKSPLVLESSKEFPKSRWSPLVLNMDKRELLSELLPIISSNRALQRLANQFREGLLAITNT